MQTASNGVMAVWQMYVADLDPTDEEAVFEMATESGSGGARIAVTAADGRAYRVEYLDGELTVNPQVWSGFLANGAWTNTEPYTNRHVFFDNGAATNSGVPVQTQRYYRIEVWLP